jgi:class 3 adenylate cyclase
MIGWSAEGAGVRCDACGADNPTANRFCGRCGVSLVATCPACGQANRPPNRFCGQCGAAITSPGPLSAPQQRAAAPLDYTPSYLIARILSSRAAIEGERKQVTALFADLKGSTELIRDLDPEDAQTLLDRALAAMMAAVHRYEGTVNQVLGHGIMALFGAPLAHEDHAVRACHAALAIQTAMACSDVATPGTQGRALQARVGLNSGEVVVRTIANDLRMAYSAVGQTVHLAARLEQLATPGTVALSPATLNLAEGYISVRPHGPQAIKGLEQRLEVYELVGAEPARTRLQVAAARTLTNFVGRQTELTTLERTLALARAGQGQVVALVGEPGVGKSRLVLELTRGLDGAACWSDRLPADHLLLAADRTAQDLLPDRAARRWCHDPPESHPPVLEA